ncbi:polysaccharide biosynthesis protein PslH [Anaerolineales bacterium]|nr:polysaccharide biosynthesis protein PslH [Anaerolineales bacterium]
MNILFLSHRIPYPPNKGDKIRSFHEIKYLAREHNLHLAFLVDDERDLEHVAGLKDYCIDYRYDVISPTWQKIKSLPYLMTNTALSVPYFYSARLQEQIDRLLDDAAIDAIFCFSSPMAEYVFRSRHYDGSRCGSARLVMDFVDVDSDKWRMYAGFTGFPHGAVYRREWRRLEEYEKRVGEAFDWSVFVSDKEVELFHSFCPQARTMAIPNGVDTDYFGKIGAIGSTDKTILFMGAMDYYPNEDAVVHFADDIWPLVRSELPNARFVIAGSKPGPRVTALAGRGENIDVTGFVPDIRPYLAEAGVFVAPFRIARGIQNKVLEAMAAGVPVVARPEAVQGVTGHNGSIRVESDPAAFARAVVECLRDEEKRGIMISEARRFVATHHDWGRNLRLLDGLLTAEKI